MRQLLFLVLAAIVCVSEPQLVSVALGQSTSTNWRGKRKVLEQTFGADLQTIANWCRDNGLQAQAEQSLQLSHDRDLGRQYIFLPSDQSMPTGSNDIEGQWLAKINQAKISHGARIFELAKQASQHDAGAVAYQLLHEVIHYDRDHATVRKILGHRKIDDGWKVASDSFRVRTGKRPHDLINWPANSYIRVLTPHFEIESNASEKRTRHLAEQLERAHLVWRQVFFEYWSSPAAVKRWIMGQGTAPISNRRFRIVFFSNRNSYLKQLMPVVRGIEVSTGYYNTDQEVSYFYDGDDRVEETWRHELTHQLFRESRGSTNKNAFEQQFIWLDEGIATYFESLTDFDSYVTLGGFESRRLQFARFRCLLEDFHLPIKQLSAIGRTNLQQRPDMIRIYGEAAGLTDMLMNDENGAFEKPLAEFLTRIYRGRVKPGAFEKIIGKSFEQLDKQYEAHLQVNSDLVEKHLTRPESRTELSLPSADLSPAAFDAIGRCVNLTWIDLSGNAIRSGDLAKMKPCQKIDQLFLNGCRFENDSLRGLEHFSNLDDLDLSGSSVQDVQLESFKNLGKLRMLRLANTGISDQGLMHLKNVKTLKSLDVSKTKVTRQGIANLKASLPNLKVTK